jgi:quercetin dioxygenase-like cupin family protein
MRLDVREALRDHPIARKLSLAFEATALERALSAADPAWWRRHAGPYHDGGWESISLWAPRGDLFEQRSKGGAFAATPALQAMPAFREVLEQLPAERNRVRLMRLAPGGHILRHSDPLHTIDERLVRLHVPVVTNPEVRFLVNDQRVIMRPGETWHVDVRFPHEVANDGTSMRVHLVADLARNPELDALLAAGASEGSGSLAGYYVRHSLPGPIRRALRIGN